MFSYFFFILFIRSLFSYSSQNLCIESKKHDYRGEKAAPKVSMWSIPREVIPQTTGSLICKIVLSSNSTVFNAKAQYIISQQKSRKDFSNVYATLHILYVGATWSIHDKMHYHIRRIQLSSKANFNDGNINLWRYSKSCYIIVEVHLFCSCWENQT